MAHVIAEPCIGTKDTACVEVCPVDCIHQAADGSSEMLYIDPAECIDCAACVPACPVDAIFAEADLPAKWAKFTKINADFYAAGGPAVGGAEAAPAAAPAAGGKKASAPAKKEPEPEPLIPLHLSAEDMYKSLSELRDDLAEQREVKGSEVRKTKSPALVGLVAAAALVLIFAISNNFSKAMNPSLYAEIGKVALGEHKPTLIAQEHSLSTKIGDMEYSIKVADSVFGPRTLFLKVPTKPFEENLYHEDEQSFSALVNQESRFFYIFKDENSDGKLDSVLEVREFWSKGNKLLGRYQRTLPPTKELEAVYKNAAERLAKRLNVAQTGA